MWDPELPYHLPYYKATAQYGRCDGARDDDAITIGSPRASDLLNLHVAHDLVVHVAAAVVGTGIDVISEAVEMGVRGTRVVRGGAARAVGAVCSIM